MATETIRPIWSGYSTQWTPTVSYSGWDCVNDTGTGDGDTTIVYTNVSGYIDLYTMADPTAFSGVDTVNFIKVFARCRKTGGSPQAVFIIRVSGTSQEKAEEEKFAPTTSYALYSGTWTSPPGGGSWTYDGIKDLQCGLKLVAGGKTATMNNTQLYCEVDYTLSGANTPPTDPTLNDPADAATVWKLKPTLILNNSTDIDPGDVVTYDYLVATDTGFTAMVASAINVASGTGGITSWTITGGTALANTYYWKCRAYDGEAYSNYATYRSFYIPMYPAPTGLMCDYTLSGVVQAGGDPCFSAVHIGSGLGGAVTLGQVQISSGNDFSSTVYDTGWSGVGSLSSGTRCPNIICSGSYFRSDVTNAYGAYIWRIRFKNGDDIESAWQNLESSVSGMAIVSGVDIDTISGIYSSNDSNARESYDACDLSDNVNVKKIYVNLKAKKKSDVSLDFNSINYRVRMGSGAGVWFNDNVMLSGADIINVDDNYTVWTYSGITLSGSVFSQGGTNVKVDWYDTDTQEYLGVNNVDFQINYIEYYYEGSTQVRFKLDRRPWQDQRYAIRKKINFGTLHDTIPVGYTAIVDINSGPIKKIASNASFNEGIQESGNMIIYYKGRTHVVYLAKYIDGDMGIWIVSKDHASDTWGDPCYIADSGTTSDTHFFPVICVDKDGYLNVFWTTHGGSMKWCKSVQVNKSGSGDDGTWGAPQNIAASATYAVPFLRNDDVMYIFYRMGANPNEHNVGFLHQDGAGWSDAHTVLSNTISGAHRTYCYGVKYDKLTDRIHLGFSFIDDINDSTGAYYCYSDDFVTWKKLDGTTCGTTDSDPVTQDDADQVFMSESNNLRSAFVRDLNTDQYGNPCLTISYFRAGDTYGIYLYRQSELMFAIASGTTWAIKDIGEGVDCRIWNGRMGAKIIIDEDNTIHVYTSERSLNYKYIQPAASGAYMDFIRNAGTDYAYNYVNSYKNNYDSTKYLYLSDGTAGRVSFSGNYPNLSGYSIDNVVVESVTTRSGASEIKHFLGIGGSTYSGVLYTGNLEEYKNASIWYKNPATNSRWTSSAISGIEIGLSKTTTGGFVNVYDMVLGISCIKSATSEYYAGEVVELISKNNGDTWTKRHITNYSAFGAPMLNTKHDFSNNQLELIWCAGDNILYYSEDKLNKFNFDGSDIRIYYSGVEIDRVTYNLFNYENCQVAFKIQEEIPANRQYGNNYYYILYRNRDAVDFKDNPYNVFKYFNSMELYSNKMYPGREYNDFQAIDPYVPIDSPIITYSTTNTTVYETSVDGLDQTAYSGITKIIVITAAQEVVDAPDTNLLYTVRVCSGNAWNESKVVYSGDHVITAMEYEAGWTISSVAITGIDTIAGTCVKVDWYGMDPAGTSTNYAFRISGIYYSPDFTNFTYMSGSVYPYESPTFSGNNYIDNPEFTTLFGHNNKVYHGGRSLLLSVSGSNLRKTFSSPITDFYFGWGVFDGGTEKSIVTFIDNSNNSFSLGLDNNTTYTAGYMSGSTWYSSPYLTSTANMYTFLAAITQSGCYGWFDGKQIATGINAITSCKHIDIHGGKQPTYYDNFIMRDYLFNPPTTTFDDEEHRGIHLVSAIQGIGKFVVNFNYIIDQKFADYRMKTSYDNQMVSELSKSIRKDNIINLYNDKKILDEYFRFFEYEKKIPLDFMKLFSVDTKIYFEDASSLENYSKYNIAYNSNMLFDYRVYVEYISSLGKDTKIEIDYCALAHSLVKILSDNLRPLEKDAKINLDSSTQVLAYIKAIYDHFLTVYSESKIISDNMKITEKDIKECIDSLNVPLFDKNISIDSRVIFDVLKKIIYDHNRYMATDYKIDYDLLANIIRDSKIFYENCTEVIAFSKIIYGYLAGLLFGKKFPSENMILVEPNFKIVSEWIKNITKDSRINVEGLLVADLFKKIVIEYERLIHADSCVVPDWLVNIMSDHNIVSDNLTIVEVMDKMPSENGLSSFRFVKVPDDYLMYLDINKKIPAEWVGELVIDRDIVIPIEFRGSIIYDNNIPISYLSNFEVDRKISFGFLGNIEGNVKVSRDNIMNIESSKKFLSENLASFEDNMRILFEHALGCISDRKIAKDYLKSIDFDKNIPIDYVGTAEFFVNFRVPVEWKITIDKNLRANIENLSSNVIDFMIPYDHQKSVFGDFKYNTEYLNSIDSILRQITIDYLGKIYRDIGIRSENNILLEKGAKVNIESLLSSLCDFKIPVENTTTMEYTNYNLGIPISWLGSLYKDGKISYDNLAKLEIDKKIVMESLLSVLPDFKIPVENVVGAEYNIYGFGIPISWLGSLYKDGKISYEDLSNLEINKNIVIENASLVDSILKKICYDSGVEVESFIKVLNSWLSEIDAKCKISCDSGYGLNKDLRFNFDFGKRVVASSLLQYNFLENFIVDKKINRDSLGGALLFILLKNMTLSIPGLSGGQIQPNRLINFIIEVMDALYDPNGTKGQSI